MEADHSKSVRLSSHWSIEYVRVFWWPAEIFAPGWKNCAFNAADFELTKPVAMLATELTPDTCCTSTAISGTATSFFPSVVDSAVRVAVSLI